MKVVVLDDEEKVCSLILQLVDWERLGMSVTGTAYNGIDGLALIEREKPDLVITDIRMPGLDGLELINRVKQRMDGIEFIIISGYHQFEYAHNAIRYGVEDYLLKPIKQSELTATLEKIAERRRNRIAVEQNARELEARLASTLGKLRQDFFQDIVFADEPQPSFPLETVNSTYGYRFSDGLFQMLLVKIDCPPSEFSEGMVRMLAEKAESIIHTQLDTICSDIAFYTGRCRIHVLLNYPKTERQWVRKQVKSIDDELQICKSIFEVAELTSALGTPVDRVTLAGQSNTDAEIAAAQRLFEQTGRLYEDVPAVRSEVCDNALAAWNQQMDRACELLDPQAARTAVDTLVDAIRAQPSCSGFLLLKTVREAGRRLVTLLRNRRVDEVDPAEIEREFERDIDLLSSAGKVTGSLRDFVQRLFERIEQSRRQAENRPIREARRYIAEHFSDNTISLEQVASIVGLSPSYFSFLFKRETGSGFLEYLTEVRIDRAKELLRTTHLTVARIAVESGYSDTKYFTRLFKRIAGVKPSEFRKLYG